MTSASLRSYSQKDLAQMAKRGGVRGWHSMRKDQLVKALLSVANTKTMPVPAKKSATPGRRATPGKSVARSAARKSNGRVQRHLSQIREKLARSKNLASDGGKAKSHIKERIVVMVRDPYWL